ncbi:MAG: hypothetical protein CFH19_00109 [Alphaproteobacteria bacterium MarineAlpha5_Bin9]|nr:MAG: hypothetical protein CFH19_00109 [Alphaproteobacteria bacterium MarineAlpha5_Bin9]|tara:strand:- start:14329 stop:14559 length:231 start_codon:yes stop_codon:yes gene_type:complete
MKIKIKKNDQRYLNDLFKKFPEIKSGRKNYSKHYKRILKNILLARAYNKLPKEKFFFSKNYLLQYKNYLYFITRDK